jgi:hypothetical protein
MPVSPLAPQLQAQTYAGRRPGAAGASQPLNYWLVFSINDNYFWSQWVAIPVAAGRNFWQYE